MKFFHRRKKTQRLFYRTPSWWKGRFEASKNEGRRILKKMEKMIKRQEKEIEK